MNKKIIRIITRINVGGPSKHVSWLSSGLDKKGWSNILVYGKTEDNEDDMSEFLNSFSIRHVELSHLKRSISFKDDFKSIVEFYKLLKYENPVIVHTHTSKAALVGRVSVMLYNLVNNRKIKTVHTFHGHTFHGYFSPLKEKLFLYIERFLARFTTNKIITISRQQQNEILNIYAVGRKDQHRIINLGIDTSFSKKLDVYTLKQDFSIPHEATVFGIVGRIAEIKNHKLFIDSVIDFNKNNIKNIFFIIIGDGDAEYVNNLVKYAQYIPNIIFVGNQMEPTYFYGALDYLVLTSKNEGTPVSILEAFACEIPVISTAVGGVIDLIGNDERGLLVDSNAFSLSVCYKKILKMNTSSIRYAAKEIVENQYSIESLVNNIDTLYQELL